jgi:hypothetical protein
VIIVWAASVTYPGLSGLRRSHSQPRLRCEAPSTVPAQGQPIEQLVPRQAEEVVRHTLAHEVPGAPNRSLLDHPGASFRVTNPHRIKVRTIQPLPSDAMDAATIALIVAAITGGAGIVQGLVQGALTSRSASVSARQEAARAAIELCDRISEHVADAGQAANEYGLELTGEFLKDWAGREPLVRRIHIADARVFAAVAALPTDSAARVPVERAMKVIMDLVALGDASTLNAAWVRDRNAIARALVLQR